jgi:predicted transcriptional regulator
VIFEESSLVSYRSRLDIIADILHVASQNVKKTQIMYQANLSYKVLKRYLTQVIEASLISFEDEKQCYMVTDKGREFLEVYKKYSRDNRHVKRRVNEINSKKKVLEEICSSK